MWRREILSATRGFGVLLLVGALLLSGCAATQGQTPTPASPAAAPTGAATATGPPSPCPTAAPSPTRPDATPSWPEDTATIIPVQPPPDGKQTRPPRVGDKAVEFTLYDLAGHRVALSSFRGKEVMLNFWASWCGPCNLEMPDTITLYQEYRSRGFEIVAVNIAETPERVSAFVERHGVPFPVVLDQSGAVRQAYFVRALPTSIFLDKEGIIEAIHVGALTEGMLRQYLSRLVDLSSSKQSPSQTGS